MNSSGPRYAIYFVPPADSAIYRFGASILGYDSYAHRAVPYPEGFSGFARPWAAIVRDAAKYGFHATLKAPFHLPNGLNENDLLAAFDRFAVLPRPLPRLDLQIALVASFLALVPRATNDAIHQLERDCVVNFDGFRAPMGASEREWRLKAGLSTNQIVHLDSWGYPFVLDSFRFHMTLTGHLASAHGAIRTALDIAFAQLGAQAHVTINRLSLLRQNGSHANFRIIHQQSLTEGAA